jgi:hypothetical protein
LRLGNASHRNYEGIQDVQAHRGVEDLSNPTGIDCAQQQITRHSLLLNDFEGHSGVFAQRGYEGIAERGGWGPEASADD